MPNWVRTNLHISGDKNEIKKLVEAVKSIDGKSDFDFNRIVPMPEELDITESTFGMQGMQYIILMANGSFILSESDKKLKHIMEERKKDNPNEYDECIELGKQYMTNIVKYGFPTWYNWCRCNWGTKWNCCDVDFDGICNYSFSTAWSFPLPIIEKLSEMFPELEITFWFADEDCGSNTGHGIMKNKEAILEDFPDDGSNHAYELYLITHPWDEDNLVLGEDGTYHWVDDEVLETEESDDSDENGQQ